MRAHRAWFFLTTSLAVSSLSGCSIAAPEHGSPRPKLPAAASTGAHPGPHGSQPLVSAAPRTVAKKQAQLVPYHGPVQHIFFHPLIAYPSRAFRPSPMERGMNDWFVTVTEFDKILNELYRHHFILIDINSMYLLKNEGGREVIAPRTLMLPKGKKPLILSIDDLNYYDYMVKYGTVTRLVLDKSGNVATQSVNLKGRVVISHNNGIVPIVDAFVAKHPGFSLHGAKGMINETGYQGVLGYRTNDVSAPNYASTKRQAEKVIARLKATGWTFASHSWGHLDDARISYTRFVNDTDRWLKEVGSLVGPTNVYVYPFGSRVRTGGPKYQYLIERGFHVLCSVGPTTYIQWTHNTLMMDRRHIDGISLHEEAKSLRDLFDAKAVMDKRRPNLY